jgi:hypothetical protein
MEIQKIIISKFNNLFNMYYVQQTNEVLQMKQRFLYLAVMLGLLLSSSFTALASDDKNTGDDPLRRSQIYEPNPFYQNTSYPMPFTPLSNPVNQPAISTGYYFVDSDDDAPDYWRPSVFVYDTNDEPGLWRRIVPGARILDPSFWTQNPDEVCDFSATLRTRAMEIISTDLLIQQMMLLPDQFLLGLISTLMACVSIASMFDKWCYCFN